MDIKTAGTQVLDSYTINGEHNPFLLTCLQSLTLQQCILSPSTVLHTDRTPNANTLLRIHG